MTEQTMARWQGLSVFQSESQNAALLATALDPGFKKLKFMYSNEIFKVQCTVQSRQFNKNTGTEQTMRTKTDMPETATQTAGHTLQCCLHGWTKVTKTKGLKKHQGRRGCLKKGGTGNSQ